MYFVAVKAVNHRLEFFRLKRGLIMNFRLNRGLIIKSNFRVWNRSLWMDGWMDRWMDGWMDGWMRFLPEVISSTCWIILYLQCLRSLALRMKEDLNCHAWQEKQVYSIGIDAHLDNYNKRMSSLKERILRDKYIDCYYHLLFIVIIVIT